MLGYSFLECSYMYAPLLQAVIIMMH